MQLIVTANAEKSKDTFTRFLYAMSVRSVKEGKYNNKILGGKR